MQRKITKQSRGANAKEKALHKWMKLQPCSFCWSRTGSILDHCKGSSYRHNKILIGHVFVNPKCNVCDHIATNGNRKELFKLYGFTDSDATLQVLKRYEHETGISFSDDELNAIADVYATNEDITDWESVL